MTAACSGLPDTCSGQLLRSRSRTVTTAVGPGRVCNSPLCAMCNRLEAEYWARQTLVVPAARALPVVSTAPLSYSPGKFGPTDADAIPIALELLHLRPTDTLVDLGCGDARVLIAAVRATGCRGRGYEIQPPIARLAEQQVAAAGLADRIAIVEGDVIEHGEFSGAVVYSYMWERVTTPLAARLRQARRVVSYLHRLPLPAREVRRSILRAGQPLTATFFVWEGSEIEPPRAAVRIDWGALDRPWSGKP